MVWWGGECIRLKSRIPGSHPDTATNILGSCDHVKSLPGSQCFPLSIGAGVVGLHYLYLYQQYSRIYSKHIHTQTEAALQQGRTVQDLGIPKSEPKPTLQQGLGGKHRWPGGHGLPSRQHQSWAAMPWEPVKLRFHGLDSTPITVPVTHGPSENKAL